MFAKQVITNSCATQAILAILLNCPTVQIGQELDNLKSFCKGMSPADFGESIGSCEKLRIAHNSFTSPDPISYESKKATKDDDVFHYISYVPFKGRLYELDGLQNGPIDLGECMEETWLAQARDAIQARMEKYAQSEIRFNLLAVMEDKLTDAERRAKKLRA